MSLTRIMCVGRGRIYETGCSLSFDHNILATIDQTIIVSPFAEDFLKQAWDKFNIDYAKITFLQDHDSMFDDLHQWKHASHYFQQGIKLKLLDAVDSEYFLIQDCDVFLLDPWAPFTGDTVNFRVEDIWNPFQAVYAEAIKKLITFDRVVDYSFVTEFCPYLKKDWIALKECIKETTGDSWIDAPLKIKSFEPPTWFSEYELLGIYKTNIDSNYTITKDTHHPDVKTFDDVWLADWSSVSVIKGKARPFKFMNEMDSLKTLDFFKNIGR